MARIVELLDVDLHDPRTRLSLAVALAARVDVRRGSRLTARALPTKRGGVDDLPSDPTDAELGRAVARL
jgi:hypothetical protein